MALCKEKVEAFWKAHDANNDGVLSADEVKAALQSAEGCKMSAENVEALGLASGSNVTREAFMEAFKNRRKEVLRSTFKKMDSDGSGKLNTKEILDIISSEGLYSEDDVKALLTKCKDSDGDKAVNLEEFIEAAF